MWLDVIFQWKLVTACSSFWSIICGWRRVYCFVQFSTSCHISKNSLTDILLLLSPCWYVLIVGVANIYVLIISVGVFSSMVSSASYYNSLLFSSYISLQERSCLPMLISMALISGRRLCTTGRLRVLRYSITTGTTPEPLDTDTTNSWYESDAYCKSRTCSQIEHNSEKEC